MKRVAIVANSPNTYLLEADLMDEVWTLNGSWTGETTTHFDLHDWETADYKPPYYDALYKQHHDFPIIILGDIAERTWARNLLVLYRLDRLPSELSVLRNSIAYMLVYAWHEGYTHIYLYSGRKEYYKYPEMGFSVYYALGWVRAKGCNVYIINSLELDSDEKYGKELKWANRKV